MPNHCSNRLVVTGPAELRTKFKNFAKGTGPTWDINDPKKHKDHECVYSDSGLCLICTVKPAELWDLDLNKFVPVPAEFLVGRDGQDAYNSGGYNWVCTNWGTKWGCYDSNVIEESNKLVYQFQTAWSPFNDETHIAMSKKFPELRLELKFAERGTSFYGTRVAKGGKIEKSEQKEGRPSGAVMLQLWRRSG